MLLVKILRLFWSLLTDIMKKFLTAPDILASSYQDNLQQSDVAKSLVLILVASHSKPHHQCSQAGRIYLILVGYPTFHNFGAISWDWYSVLFGDIKHLESRIFMMKHGHRLVFLRQQNWSSFGHCFTIFQWIPNLGTLHHGTIPFTSHPFCTLYIVQPLQFTTAILITPFCSPPKCLLMLLDMTPRQF